MSYDYNGLVLKIHQHRKAKDWQNAVETFATLSGHCPMTPLLWIQYAHDAGQMLLEISERDALDIRLDTLELGLSEFPGCALLHLHFVELRLQQLQLRKGDKEDIETTIQRVREDMERSINAVGRGSHRNEDVLVVQIYQHYANFVAHYMPDADAISIFVKRAKVPMLQANDTIRSEMEAFAREYNLTITAAQIEELEKHRRHVATWFQSLYTLEDDIDEAMHNEQILPRYVMDLEHVDWEALVSVTNTRYWMGLGGATSADAFIKYAQNCSRFPKKHVARGQLVSQEEDLQTIHGLALPIYERGVAECPTVESMWLAYLKCLVWLILKGNRRELASTLQSVSSRAVRNCPYSLALAQFRIASCLTLTIAGHCVLDPDELVQMVDEIIQAKFLTATIHHLQLYMTAIQTVKRRILFLLAPNTYDEPLETNEQARSSTNLTDASDEEIQDLAEDLRELYDTADKYLCKQQWTSGRVLLWTDRSRTEMYLLTPLMTALDGDTDATIASPTESVRCFDKLLTIHPHPDSFRSYIQMLLAQPVASPQDIVIKFRRMRHYYQKGLHSTTTTFGGDPQVETARQNMRNEYLDFEQLFGSEKSYGIATKLVQKVMLPLRVQHPPQHNPTHEVPTEEKKRKPDTGNAELNQAKKRKIDNASPLVHQPSESAGHDGTVKSSRLDSMDVEVAVQMKPRKRTAEEKPEVVPISHKVKIGKLEYPAHPLTIRVSNLAPETHDMDLVDTFRPKCGAIVHAKIIREKHASHGKGKSKGWGLIQFESRESVDKALELHDIIGLHEKTLQISRSHMPAASLVPPGMHRVRPKGEGKASKRNLKVRDKGESRNNQSTSEAEAENVATTTEKATPVIAKVEPATTPKTGLLILQPRGVIRRKPKLGLKK